MTTNEIDRLIESQTLVGMIEEMQHWVSEARAFQIATAFIGVGLGAAAFRIHTVDDVHKLRAGGEH